MLKAPDNPGTSVKHSTSRKVIKKDLPYIPGELFSIQTNTRNCKTFQDLKQIMELRKFAAFGSDAQKKKKKESQNEMAVMV